MTDTKAPPMPSNHTVGKDKDDRPRVQIVSSGGSYRRNSGLHVDIHGLDSHEFKLIEGFMHGHQWITVSEGGRLRAIPTYKKLPAPDEDEMMLPFWRPAEMGVETQLEMFEFVSKPEYFSPSIIIQSLCGYCYSPENYRREAANLQRWGFECLRSRRDDSGRYHEMWLLSSTYSAKEQLKEAIDAVKQGNGFENRRVEVAVSFLCRHALFGSLDVSAQRVAMTAD